MSSINMNATLPTIDLTNAIPCRTKSNGDFYAIPGENGLITCVKVWTPALHDTEKRTAFSIEQAHEEYLKQIAIEADRKAEIEANKKPKVVAESTVKADKIVADYLATATFTDKTATELMGMMPFEGFTIMAVGSALRRAVDKGLLTSKKYKGDNKPYYSTPVAE